MFVSEGLQEHPPLHHSPSQDNVRATTYARRTESTREREVFRYLRPWIDNFHNATLPRVVFSTGDDTQNRKPIGCDDTALAAFAQLGAARLSAQRCLISLVSSSTEYVLAESTKSLSLQHDVAHGENDGLWLGTSAFAREEGITNIAVEKWRRAIKPRESPSARSHYYTESRSPHWFIISDIPSCEELSTIPYLRDAARLPLRFFCSVPIRSPTGSVVGSYSILDERPRYGVSANEMSFLEDMASTISKHFEAVALSARQQRSEKLIQGIGLFNAGKDTLRDWWMARDEEKVHRGRISENSVATEASRQDRADNEFGTNNSLEDFERTSGKSKPTDRALNAPELNMTTKDNSIARNMLNETQSTSAVKDFAKFDRPQEEDASATKQSPKATERQKGLQSSIFSLHTEINKTYDRASNLIREALGAEGALFLDASLSHVFERNSASTGDTSASYTSASDTDPDPVVPSSEDCPVLGFSTRSKSSLKGFSPSKKHLSLSKTLQARLMKRYPRGRIFNFAEDGSTYSSSGEEGSSGGDTKALAAELARKVKKCRSRSAKEGAALSEIFSGVRSIAFLPIWDSSTQRFRAAALVWVTTPLRHFDPTEDMTYLQAFTNSIMAEVGRLETIAADQAKATFISSVSHELRSPLHGILGGIEFLEGTTLNAFQQDMARAVKMAGITLLDTVNNILDFTKIDSRTQTPKNRRRDLERKSSNAIDDEQNSMIDLAKLTEDVVETVVTGRRFEAMATSFENSSRPSQGSASNSRPGSSSAPEAVSVSLVVPQRPHWWVKVSPGAFTRILTNLVGNALKYTREGYVRVEIEVGDPVDRTKDTERRPLILTIEDTGVGMSDEYLQNSLYTPFRQENSHSNGTGLGLSIVKMILEGMDGKINITSKIGKGTKVKVRCLADFVVKPPKSDTAHDPMALACKALSQKNIRLLTDRKSLGENVSASRTDILQIFSTWFGKEPDITPFLQAEPSGDLYLAIDTELNMEEARNPGYWQNLLHGSPQHRHLIVLSSSIYTNAAIDAEQFAGGPVTYINQPIGPRKLAKSILRTLDQTGISVDEVGKNTNPLHGHYPLEASFSPIRKSANNSPLTSSSSAAQKLFGMGIRFASPLLQNFGSPEKQFHRGSVASIEEANTRDSESVEASDTGQPARYVLLVDDNEINMKLLVALVKKLKLDYRCAQNGLIAVQEYSSDPQSFYLILMDMSMPIMDGFRATEEIRSLERKSDLPRCKIVALTGVTNPEARRNAFSSGVDKFMAKPISMKQITLIVNEIKEVEEETEDT